MLWNDLFLESNCTVQNEIDDSFHTAVLYQFEADLCGINWHNFKDMKSILILFHCADGDPSLKLREFSSLPLAFYTVIPSDFRLSCFHAFCAKPWRQAPYKLKLQSQTVCYTYHITLLMFKGKGRHPRPRKAIHHESGLGLGQGCHWWARVCCIVWGYAHEGSCWEDKPIGMHKYRRDPSAHWFRDLGWLRCFEKGKAMWIASVPPLICIGRTNPLLWNYPEISSIFLSSISKIKDAVKSQSGLRYHVMISG